MSIELYKLYSKETLILENAEMVVHDNEADDADALKE